MTERLMLLDTASLYYRAFYGVPDRRRTPDTPASNAVRGLIDMIATLVTQYAPTHLVACWDDDWRPAFRVDAIPSYKAHRVAEGSDGAEDTPEALSEQVPVIATALESVGLTRWGSPGYEADDVIGTLAARGVAAGAGVDVVTGDRDLFQLVDDATGVRVIYTARGGVRTPDLVDQSYLSAKHGVSSGDAYADMSILRGDSSDGLPGVKGIGDKTAAALICEHGSLEGVQRALGQAEPPFTKARLAALREAEDYLAVAPGVVRVARDCPLPEVEGLPGELPTQIADPATLWDLVESHNLNSPVKRLLTALNLD